MVCPWTSYGFPMSFPRAVRGLSMGCSRVVRGLSVGCPWAAVTGNFGGATRLCTCPNGHVYGVGDCRMLNGGGNCVECGTRDGGSGLH